MSATADNNNPLRKIIIMVTFAIIVFVAFLAYSVQSSVQNNERLSTIQSAYFPVLERVDANIVRLDKMEERFVQSVMIGEKDVLDQAGEYYQQADKVFGEMLDIFPDYRTEITKLRDELRQYNTLATETSLSLLRNEGDDTGDKIAKMNEALSNLRRNIQQFRTFSYEQFVATLTESKAAASRSLYMGVAIGVMNLLFMGVLVFFIRNNVKMMAVIAEQNANLEKRVADRTAELQQKTNDINAMLHNMRLGVCTVTANNRLHPEYSSYLETIVGRADIAGNELGEVLLHNAQISHDVQDQILVSLASIVGEDAMMYEFNGHLLIKEMDLLLPTGEHKILQLDWSPILTPEGNVDKVLLIIQDVTHLRELEREAHDQKEELALISQIIKVAIGKFNEFTESSQGFVKECRDIVDQYPTRNREAIAALFRNMHTIKGNSRTYGFTYITEIAHEIEQHYDALRKSEEAVWNQEELQEQLDRIEAILDRYLLINEDKLGRKGRAGDLITTRGNFISNEQIDELKKLAAALSDSATKTTLQQRIARLGLVPLQRIIDGAIDSLSALSKELGKPVPRVELHGDEITLNTEFAEALKSSLIHIMRNSMDHGIESPDDRVTAGKSVQGELRFEVWRREQQTVLQIADDGRGLALHKLHKKGVEAGIFPFDKKIAAGAVAELIFDSGLSTADAVTEVSGRGVGMDAVRTFLERQGSSIQIVLAREPETLGFVPFHFVVLLPEGKYAL